MVDISVIIRTFNEERYLGELLTAVSKQSVDPQRVEVVIVDSGSTDRTLEIARHHNCRILNIAKDDFTFGRSLNLGCANAIGEYLVFISGHCVPMTKDWLQNLLTPLRSGAAVYSYGGQVGRDTTKFSEQRVFEKYFDPRKRIPQPPFFVNNANAALKKDSWQRHPFDETITGLEDMHLAKQLVHIGETITFAENAGVYHIHDETWQQVTWRFEREALALRAIDPALHMSRRDLVRCIISSVFYDWREAAAQSLLLKECFSIVAFRVCQYWGSYRGSRASRQLSEETKRRYFYPQRRLDDEQSSSPLADEGPQRKSAW